LSDSISIVAQIPKRAASVYFLETRKIIAIIEKVATQITLRIIGIFNLLTKG